MKLVRDSGREPNEQPVRAEALGGLRISTDTICEAFWGTNKESFAPTTKTVFCYAIDKKRLPRDAVYKS